MFLGFLIKKKMLLFGYVDVEIGLIEKRGNLDYVRRRSDFKLP